MRWVGWFITAAVLWGFAPAAAQAPVEVFAKVDTTSNTLTVYFTNAISGLSAPATIEGFRPEQVITDELTLTRQGVMLRDPRTRGVILITPDGATQPHPFIPQQAEELVRVDWVVSPDGGSIAWVEVFPGDDRWISHLYTAEINGANLTPLPDPPPETLDPLRRINPLAVSNDRAQVFYDAYAPIEPRATADYFEDYENLYRYTDGTFQQLPGEPGCICGAAVRGSTYLRLEGSPGGFNLHWWELGTQAEQTLEGIGPPFAQAGDFLFAEAFPLVFYTQGDNLQDDSVGAEFALVKVDLTTRTQQIVSPPSAQRFKAMAMTDRNTLMVVDVYGSSTYKLDLRDGSLQLVSEATWLGTIE